MDPCNADEIISLIYHLRTWDDASFQVLHCDADGTQGGYILKKTGSQLTATCSVINKAPGRT